MDVDVRKKLLLESLKQSFVDDYDVYKNIIKQINNNFDELKLDYQWTYDNFCIEFINMSMEKLEKIDIFRYPNFNKFVSNFWKFNMIIIKTIIINKFEELEYDYKKNIPLINKSHFLN